MGITHLVEKEKEPSNLTTKHMGKEKDVAFTTFTVTSPQLDVTINIF